MARNLGELILASADTYGDDVAFQVRRGFRKERLSFKEVGQQARRVAAWFAARGLQPGDRVVVWSPNMPEYALLYFGAWLAGLVVVPIDVRTKQEVVDRFVAAATPRLGFKSKYLEGFFPQPVEETHALEDLLDLVAASAPIESAPEVRPGSLCEIAFTSGTTGVPKGVMLTHGNLLAQVEALQAGFPLERRYRAVSLLPLSHIFEQAVNLLLVFSSGVRLTYVPKVNAATIVRTLREERITCFVLVPELLRLMLAGLERRARQSGKGGLWDASHRVARHLPLPLRRLLFRPVHQALGGNLEFIGVGSAPLDVKVASAWERIGVRIFEGYGLTEVAGAATINSQRGQRLGSAGRALPGVDLRIGEDGEIQMRGGMVTPGYYGNEELTERALVDGWFRTGDVGRIDPDGFLHISGRESNRIVLADGRKAYPEDIEQELNAHSLLRESCVVGLPRNSAETVHAVLLTETPERSADIVREVNRQLAAHQQITSHSVWADSDFPRTPLLKIDRNLVRAAVERREAAAPAATPPERPAAADPLVAIIARVAERPVERVRDDAELGIDLGLDSIGRVELLAAIEDEMGRVIDELQVSPQTTVGELRRLTAEAPTAAPAETRGRWLRAGWARAIGRVLLGAAFRLQDRWLEIEWVHPERAAAIPFPSILIFNYQGPYVPLLMLRALSPRLRARVAIAADARLWEGFAHWQGILAALAVQAFPFVKSGGAVRPSLEELGRWLDDGYAVVMSPEGNPELDGKMLPFLGGTGLMAVEMRVPVVPFRVDRYDLLFEREPQFPYLPVRRGRVRVIIGEPVPFPRGMSYADATERARRALVETE